MHLLKGLSLLLTALSTGVLADDNARFSIDISTRVIHNESTDKTGLMSPLGFDYHNVFSSEKGDIGTLVMQLYMTRIDNLKPHPGFFNDEHDWELVTRIFNFNYTGLGRNLPNFKVGHIELPYGIEYRINTNGTLRQYNHGVNLGPKADWGASLNKQYQHFEYEFSLTTGGGQDFTNQNDSFVFTGYLGSAAHNNTQWGLSVNRSRINRVERESIALDLAHYQGLWGYFAEVQLGEKQTNQYRQAFIEVNRAAIDETWLVYSQLRYQSEEGDTSRRDWVLGATLTVNKEWEASIQASRFIEQGADQLAAQLRWRF